MFDALAVAHQIVRLMARLIDRVAKRDPDLARQMRKATTSIPLNVAEGRQRAGKDGRHLYTVARGSAAELGAQLEVALAWGYIDDASEVLALIDRERAMLWRLTH
jgi:four helix bundle protein